MPRRFFRALLRSLLRSLLQSPTAATAPALFAILLVLPPTAAQASPADEDGYALWLRYRPLPQALRGLLRARTLAIASLGADSPTLRATRAELQRGLAGLASRSPPLAAAPLLRDGSLVLARASELPPGSPLASTLRDLGPEGYLVRRTRLRGADVTLIAANADAGLLYGAFAWLRALQGEGANARAAIGAPAMAARPALPLRVLDHWDNLDRSVERGYAGQSIWNWWELPDLLDPRYTDYARANASVGINGAVLNNVNARAEVLGPAFIAKAAAVAAVLRPYGMRIYLSVRWSTPRELGETDSADPLDPAVADWWRRKADALYRAIPDFGGFLVKANSEGQPGPQDYGRSHADGANMLARALAPHGGVVMWRAFVYDPPVPAALPADRAAQAFDGFAPLDGRFDPNVIVQVKNGPIDFQPREPAHPLFGAMPATRLMAEFQLTKEYLGFATHLAYLAPLFEETLGFDTRAGGRSLRVADVLQGTQSGAARGTAASAAGSTAGGTAGGMAGVANIGASRNWTGSDFDQANWYAFGRLAWDPRLGSRTVAREWVAQTWSRDPRVLAPVSAIMLRSREAVVDYMTPLGLHHLMGSSHHHGPAPWVDDLARADWNPVYYHRAGRDGIGFERSTRGSGAATRYAPELARLLQDPATTPPSLLLWFHHLPWDYRMPDGTTLWEALVAHYDHGVAEVAAMRAAWEGVRPLVDARRGADVAARLARQEAEARWWRDACLAYFQDLSGLPLPPGARPPAHPLAYYKALRFTHVPGQP